MRLPQGAVFRGCSHSLRFSLPHSLGPQIAPTKILLGIWRPGPCTPRIAWLVAHARMWHRYLTVMGNCHGWTFTSWITVLSAAPYRIRLPPRVDGGEAAQAASRARDASKPAVPPAVPRVSPALYACHHRTVNGYCAKQAWERGKRCNDYPRKPFVGTLWVSKPTR